MLQKNCRLGGAERNPTDIRMLGYAKPPPNLRLIPENIRVALKPDIRLFAHVNTGAEKSDDLYFEKFELAPEPDEDDGLA
ncbi:MAG: hypothetical protein V7K77_21650 [Nostoc sp.]|uniref:hypothetical protein n=1 Tax=Nostoc sp. TaxID=1180 RepID=UPI002FF915E9